MKTYLMLLLFLAGFVWELFAQGENNIWMFGKNYSLDFNNNPPLLKDDVYLNGTAYGSTSQTTMPNSQHKYNYAQSVCDENGNILFMVKSYVFNSGLPAPSIFDRDEVPIPGTEFLVANDFQQSRPVVVPHPGNSNQYYIFYVRNGGLIYCLFDLSLNNGKGDIVPGFKNVLHLGYNSIVSGKLITVRGCDGLWLIVRHRIQNQYLSFKIDVGGIATAPVISEVGQMAPQNYYGDIFELVASPNGKLLATVVNNGDLDNLVGGTEMYDFEKCSGKVKNARFLDSGSSFSYGAIFSPDNSKLYVAYSEYNAAYAQISTERRDHKVYQFDLSLGNIAAIENSKTLIFTNPTINAWEPFCPFKTPMVGGMRIGPDGKLYLLNGAKQVCPSTGGVALAIHVINSPDLTGLACNPSLNQIYNSQNGMDNGLSLLTRTNFPTEIVKATSTLPDTLINIKPVVTVCFKEDTTLQVSSEVGCIEWSNGSTDTSIVVGQSGKYWVRYYKDCTVYIDSFDVSFTPMPNVDKLQFGCPGFINLKAGDVAGQSFEMELYNSSGGKIYGGGFQNIHMVTNLDEGMFKVKIKSGFSCDTTIEVELKAYPLPVLSIDPSNSSITNGESITLTANGAINYQWTPQQYLNTFTTQQVIAKPKETTRFRVVGINDYGCWDTAFATVEVTHNKTIPMPNAFSPNGDGKNDVFRIPEGDYIVRKFEVLNRFGESLHREMGSSLGWDGKYKGRDCDIGVYYYAVQLDFQDGTTIPIKGEVTLIR